MTASPLSPHVLHVVGLSAKKQMSRIHADAVVTPMKDAAAMVPVEIGDLTEMQFIADPVRGAFEFVECHRSVSGGQRRQFPRPTLVGPLSLDVSPKLGGYVLWRRENPVPDRTARRGAKAARSWTFDIVSTANSECAATRLARRGETPEAHAFVTTSGRTQIARRRSSAKNRATNSARRIAVFDRWCHAQTIANFAFDDKLIEILRKYGLLPPVAAGTAAALNQQEPQL